MATICTALTKWAKRQLKQKSTWRGVAMLAAASGVLGAPEQAHVIIGAIGVIFGAGEVVRNESGE